MYLFLFIVLLVIATGLSIWAFREKKTEAFSQIGQFLQGIAALVAIGVAIHSGDEIINKIDTLNAAVQKIDNVVGRIDKNITEIKAPKSLFEEPPETQKDQTEFFEKKRKFWTTAIGTLEHNASMQLKIENKDKLIQSLVDTRNSEEAAKMLEEGVQLKNPNSPTVGLPIKVNKTPTDGTLIFSISK